MTHETGVHRADAELALGREPVFAPAVAADGVSEHLANLWRARAWRRDVGKLRGEGQELRLSSTDTADRWTIVRDSDGFTWSHGCEPGRVVAAGGPATAVVSGPAQMLYLLVWKRITSSQEPLSVGGDPTVLEYWSANSSV
jgi:hypothetical protein